MAEMKGSRLRMCEWVDDRPERLEAYLADCPSLIQFRSEQPLRWLVPKRPSAADIPRIAEPWFLAFDANIGFHPTMVPADLEKAGPDIAAAAKAYG